VASALARLQLRLPAADLPGQPAREDNVEQIKPGMSQAQVAALLGTPPVADPSTERWDTSPTDAVATATPRSRT
jgi:hypothetical protein